MFVDKVTVLVKAGDGGNGVVSFRHEKYVDKGGPDGGDGGNGGSVVVVGSKNQDTLATYRFKKKITAENGHPGSERKKHGKSGRDLVVQLPVGTVITKNDGTILADLVDEEQKVIIAKGGKGGFGNAHFSSSVRQVPRVAEKGEPGEDLELTFELKLIADVGLVGLPNAGKSTLLSRISHAKPEIANYPFTTLTPNLGVVDVDGESSFLVADIPGLIEGASDGKGLGDEFLRHIERTSVILHLVDAYSDDITKNYKTIQNELKNYGHNLSSKPQIVLITKVDGLDEDIIKDIHGQLKKIAPPRTKIMTISSLSGVGLLEMLREVLRLVKKEKLRIDKQKESTLPILTFEEPADRWHIQKQKNEYVVTGKKIESFARRTDFSDYHGIQRLRDILKKMGIINALVKQGIDPGQQIVIGDPAIGKVDY